MRFATQPSNSYFFIEGKNTPYFFAGRQDYAMLTINPGDSVHLKVNTLFFNQTIEFSGDDAAKKNVGQQMTQIKKQQLTSLRYDLKNVIPEDTTFYFQKVDLERNKYLKFLANCKEIFEWEDSTFSKISDINTKSFEQLKAKARKKLAFERLTAETIGKQLLEFTGTNLAGKEVSVRDFYGKPMVIDFWTPWCIPCIKEFPALKKLEEKYKEEVTVLSVGIWEKEKKWSDEAPKHQFNNNMSLTRQQSAPLKKAYSLHSIPRYFLIDSEGKIVSIAGNKPSRGLEKEIQQMLKQVEK